GRHPVRITIHTAGVDQLQRHLTSTGPIFDHRSTRTLPGLVIRVRKFQQLGRSRQSVQMRPQLPRLTRHDQDRLEHAVATHQSEIVHPNVSGVGVGDSSVEKDKHAHDAHTTDSPSGIGTARPGAGAVTPTNDHGHVASEEWSHRYCSYPEQSQRPTSIPNPAPCGTGEIRSPSNVPRPGKPTSATG